MNLDLLRSAFPDGYLARSGARSTHGWVCTVVTDRCIEWAKPAPTPPGSFEDVHGCGFDCGVWSIRRSVVGGYTGWLSTQGPEAGEAAWKAGHLLPDLSDPATWALALRELAGLLGWSHRGDLTWRHVAIGGPSAWVLVQQQYDIANKLLAFAAAICGGDQETADAVQDDDVHGFTGIGVLDPVEALLLALAKLRGAK